MHDMHNNNTIVTYFIIIFSYCDLANMVMEYNVWLILILSLTMKILIVILKC